MLAAAGLIATGAIFILWLLWDEFRHWNDQPFDVVVTPGRNDDKQAVETFVQVVGEAEHSLIIHDDGDKTPGTIYDDPAVIQAMDDQMKRHETLAVKCLFRMSLAAAQLRYAQQPSRVGLQPSRVLPPLVVAAFRTSAICVVSMADHTTTTERTMYSPVVGRLPY